jgi:hypothetical protein
MRTLQKNVRFSISSQFPYRDRGAVQAVSISAEGIFLQADKAAGVCFVMRLTCNDSTGFFALVTVSAVHHSRWFLDRHG